MHGNGKKTLIKTLIMTIKFFLLTFYLFSFLTCFSQEKETPTQEKHNPGIFWYVHGWKHKKNNHLPKYDRLVFDLTYNDFSGDVGLLSQGINSIGVTTNMIFDIPMNKNNTISFGTGWGFKFAHIEMRDKFISNHGGIVLLVPKTSEDNYSKNKLVSSNAFIPFELRFRTKGWRHFKFHIGGKLGFQTGLLSKKLDENEIHTSKSYYGHLVNRFTYSIHSRIGIRNYALFASYNFNSLFKNKKSIDINWLQLGLSISLF